MFSKTPRERPKVKKVGLELCKPTPGHSSENSSAVSPAPQSAMHGSGAPGYKPNPTTEEEEVVEMGQKFPKSSQNPPVSVTKLSTLQQRAHSIVFPLKIRVRERPEHTAKPPNKAPPPLFTPAPLTPSLSFPLHTPPSIRSTMSRN